MKLILLFGVLLSGTANASSCEPMNIEQVSAKVVAFAEASLGKHCAKKIDSVDSVKLVKVCQTVEKIDQGSRDYYFQLVYRFEKDSHPPRYTNLVVGKYDISNPAVPSMELLGISGFCQ